MDKKKVAILTWYMDINYGTALQAGALFQVIKVLGYDPAMIQYRPRREFVDRPQEEAAYWLRKIITKVPAYFRNHISSDERTALFQTFLEEKIVETEPANSLPELQNLNEKFHAFVCGSDQIWSLNGYDEHYFLPFVEDPRKKIAYAPSMGRESFLTEKQKSHVVDLISSFRHLSVREIQSAKLIRNVTGQKAEVVLDPTLLMDGEQWAQYAEPGLGKLRDEKYILCYFLGKSQRYRRYVQGLATYLNLPYYEIPVARNQYHRKERIPFEVGPKEFVSLIRNAAFVCTDSFHGMVFAANFNVPFCVFERFRKGEASNQNMRITSFLKQVQLESRLVDPKLCGGYENIVHCNYDVVTERLKKLRKDSLDYLAKALEAAVAAREKPTERMPFRIAVQCCGCGACAAVCPVKAVQIVEDEWGFRQYKLDETVCVQCGKCRSVCPMADISAMNMKEACGLYEMQSCSASVKNSASSGGIGHELARYALEQGYQVFGCAYEREHNRARHIRITTEQEDLLPLLQGSKYLQSSTAEVMDAIRNGGISAPVAFFGTPCQTAAVDKLLRKSGQRENALLVDLICLGVPSAHLWDRQIRQMDEQCGTGEHPDVWFEYRKKNCRERMLRTEGNGKVYLQNVRKDDFYAFFHRKLCHMQSCHDCPYRERSAADLRLGDYWGPRFDKEKEMHSMVIANTPAGRDVLLRLESLGRCRKQEYPLEEYWLVHNPYNSMAPEERETILRQLKDSPKTLHELRKQYCGFLTGWSK